MEKDADMKIVDHTKKNLPSDTYGSEFGSLGIAQLTVAHSYSFRYLERSIESGALEDPEVYRVGPSAPRPMGATQIPKKGTRSDYSLKDDQVLYDWLYPFEQRPGAPISGNKIYQELERRVRGHHRLQRSGKPGLE